MQRWAEILRLPLIEDLTTGPLSAGSTLLAEFDPTSQWYAASLTMAAGWLKTGGRVSYHVTAQQPDNIRSQLRRLGLNTEELETSGKLRIFDWYSATLGQKSKEDYAFSSLKVADLSILFSKYLMLRPDIARDSSDWLRILDDMSCLARFNDEKSWLEFVLTRIIPIASLWRSTGIGGVIKGIHSDWVYKRLEAANDGVIDFKLEEEGKKTRDLIRIRTMRNVGFDREWHELKIGENFEVTLEK